MICPNCQSSTFTNVKMGLISCGGCRLILNGEYTQPESVKNIHEEWFSPSGSQGVDFWQRSFDQFNHKRTYARIVKQGCTKGKLLEVGVGNGSLLKFMKDQGFEVEGVDLLESIAETVNRLHQVKVFGGGLESIPKDRKYDLIVAHHVLEHTLNPLEFLTFLKGLLKDTGLLFLAVPNIDSWGAFLPGWVSYQPYHLLYFNRATLAQTLQKSGLKTRELYSHESFSGWLIALIQTPKRLFRKSLLAKPSPSKGLMKRNVIVVNLYRLIMVVSGMVTFPLRWVQSRLGKGDELIAVIEKA